MSEIKSGTPVRMTCNDAFWDKGESGIYSRFDMGEDEQPHLITLGLHTWHTSVNQFELIDELIEVEVLKKALESKQDEIDALLQILIEISGHLGTSANATVDRNSATHDLIKRTIRNSKA